MCVLGTRGCDEMDGRPGLIIARETVDETRWNDGAKAQPGVHLGALDAALSTQTER